MIFNMYLITFLLISTINITQKVNYKSASIDETETHFRTDFEKLEKFIFKEKEILQPRTVTNFILNCTYKNFSHIFIDRSVTMRYNDSIVFMSSHQFYIAHNLFFSLNIITQDVDAYSLRIERMYLGKILSQGKYNSSFNTSSSNNPKSALLIIILLFMCGDTGASINPGPVCMNDAIDPDLNHFIPNFEFQKHSVETFAENSNHVQDSFNIIHNNARSIMTDGRIGEYLMLLRNLKTNFDILIFTESWLTPDDINQCKFDGFQAIHLLRPVGDPNFKLKGGGVSLFIRDSLNFKHRTDLTIMQPFMECSFIEMQFNDSKYIIGGIYRPPDTNLDQFIDYFNHAIEPLKSSHKLILLGDYNVDLLEPSYDRDNFEACIQSNYLMPTILSPTRVASFTQNGQEVFTKTLIDNIFLNHNIKCLSGVIETSITDHYSVYVKVPELNKSYDIPTTIKYRLINSKSQRTFNNYLCYFKINDVLNIHSAELAYAKFYNIFSNCYEKSFPIKTKTITQKGKSYPWISDSHLNDMKERDKLCKLSKKNKIAKSIYTDFRNDLKNRLRFAKKEYFSNLFELYKNNIKKTWGVINGFIRSKVFNKKVLITNENGNNYEESEIPSKFIEYYTSIADELTAKIPHINRSATSYLGNRINHTFQMSPISPIEVESVIENLKDNGNNPNCFATSVLLDSKHILTPIFCHLINLFVEQGYFPDNLKIGCITPIFKGGDKDKINNYRPVCSLSPLSKIIEKVIANRMINYLEDYDILSKTQFGFRKNMGTENALLNYIDNIQNQLNKYKYTISIFMDLSKAFDVINHDILKHKLYHYGFRGNFLNFLLNYIKDRHYFVHVNGINSDMKILNIGVPQGSTLGPLLFLIYINDMIKCSNLLFLTQFADDSTITYSSLDLEQAIVTVEHEFNRVLDWLAANKLIINLTKTHLMLFTTRARPDTISILAKGQEINEVKEIKFLGVILDNDLKWDSHIEYISKKISKSVSILKMLKFSFPNNVLKNIYFSLIYPYFTYCNLVWGSAFSTHLDILVKLQKKAVRSISKVGYLDHTGPLFHNLKILQVHEIYNYNCCKFIYQCYNNKSYNNFKDKLLTNSDYHDHNTRSKDLLRKPRGRLKMFDNTALERGIDIWNTLYDCTKNAGTILSFKTQLKAYMMNNE